MQPGAACKVSKGQRVGHVDHTGAHDGRRNDIEECEGRVDQPRNRDTVFENDISNNGQNRRERDKKVDHDRSSSGPREDRGNRKGETDLDVGPEQEEQN